MNKKLRKLLKNPKAFWRDSKWNTKNKRIRLYNNKEEVIKNNIHILNSQLNELKNDMSASYNTINALENKVSASHILPKPISTFNIDYIIKGLGDIKLDALYIKPIKKNLKWVIATNINVKKEFFTIFVSFLHKEYISVKYKLKGKIKTPKTINEFWSDISLLRNIDIRLQTLRDIEQSTVWFRLEFWDEFEDYYLSPTANHISRKLWKDIAKKNNIFIGKGLLINYNNILAYPHESTITFDIDLVFTWVNSDDEDWKKLYAQYKPLKKDESDATSTSRFLSRDELKYALRSWDEYGKFIKNIYIVSNCKPPKWLDLTQENIKWVYHEEIMPTNVLPTFSSHAIETSLHKIKGLNNYFIYSNDDFLLVKPLNGSDFYFSNGIAKLRLEAYGNVNCSTKEGDPDYLNAARNANILLEYHFQKTTTQLHTHSPQSMRIDILEKMEEQYSDAFQDTMQNKFRTHKDIAVTGYMYHHYAFLSGHALQSDVRTELVQQNHDFKNKLQKIINLKTKNRIEELPLSVCLNDGSDSHLNDLWNKEIMNFLETFFPKKSKYEKS